MPTSAIGKDLNYGYAGKISRNPLNKITPRMVKSILNSSSVETMSNIPFGAAVVLNTDGTVSLFGQSGTGVSAATAANFGGIAVAEVQQTFSYSLGAGGGSANSGYVPSQPCDCLNEGSATVFMTEGTPTAGGAVYIVTVAGTTSPVGSLIATSTPEGSGATAVQLPNCSWTTGKVDANGICEMTIRYASNV